MADNLTLRLKNELERRHGVAVSEADVESFLRKREMGMIPKAPAPQPVQTVQSLYPWEKQEEIQETKGGVLNAVGVGLWTAFDTAAFGVPGALVKEEEALDFEDPLAKWAGAVGGLAGFVAGAPMKVGAKALGVVAKPFIQRAGFESLEKVSKDMVRRGVSEGLTKKQAKKAVGHYKKLAHKAQINKNFAENFSKHADDLLINYTDDAIKLGDITPNEAAAIRKMFGENYTKRPIQDFIGLMAERGIAKTNPRVARVAGHILNDTVMFGLIDTVFEGVSTIEDGDFDWTAPVWGVATGAAFSQVAWLNPVGKGAKWRLDFKQGLRSAFGGKSPYEGMGKEKLAAYAKFFGESLPKIENGSKVVTIAKGDKKVTLSLTTDDIFKKLDDVFGKEESAKVLSEYLDTQRKVIGREMIKWSTSEAIQNLGKNWSRMMLGGLSFNATTLGHMAAYGIEPDLHDILPHFLIGSFLQLGRNPAKFDLNSTRMNEIRNNLRTLGVDTIQLNHIPSFQDVGNRFHGGLTREKHKETLRLIDEANIGSDVYELTDTRLAEGETSVQIAGNSKFDILYEKLRGHYKHRKPKDTISTSEADSIIRAFEKETGLKTLDDYQRYFDEISADSTKGFEDNLVDVIERIRQEDIAGEIEIVKNPDGTYQIPESLRVDESIYEMARRGDLKFIRDADGEVLSGQLAVEKLQEKIDGYFAISQTTSAIMQRTQKMPAGLEVKEIKRADLVERVYKIIEDAELMVNDSFPNKASYADPFTFIGSFGDYVQIIGRNVNVRNSESISDIFSLDPKIINKSELVSHMNKSGIIKEVLGEKPELIQDVGKIEIDYGNMSKEKIEERDPQLKRALRRILMLQSISGGYRVSKDVDRTVIPVDNVEGLLNFLKPSIDIERMPSWMHEEAMNFIIRDKIGKSNLRTDEVSAFMNLAETGMSEFRFDMKGDTQGFKLALIDENFVPSGLDTHASEYNSWVRDIVDRSGGLIEISGKVKVINGTELRGFHHIVSKATDGVDAQSRLIEFVNALPDNSRLSNTLGQYVIEGGAPDVESWLISHGVLEYDKKSSNNWNINIKKFNDNLKNRLMNRIERQGFTPDYIESMYLSHENASKAAYDRAYDADSRGKFNVNDFLEKYNFDDLDYGPESKDVKKQLVNQLFLQPHSIAEIEAFPDKGYDATGVVRDKVVDEVLNRISVKDSSGEWVRFNDVKPSEKNRFRQEIVQDIIKLIPSQTSSIRVNSFKFENGKVVEGETFQQQTRQSTLYRSYDLPYMIIERDAVVYDAYNGRYVRRFFDIFGESPDLPSWENASIEGHRTVFESAIKSKKSAFGLDYQDGFVTMHLSRDTNPIAVPRNHLNKIHSPYIEYANKIIDNENVDLKTRNRIRKMSEKMADEAQVISDAEYNVALSELTFFDMLSGKNKIEKFEKFLNGELDPDKIMGRIKLYDSKNFFRPDRNLLHSFMNIYRHQIRDMETYDSIGKMFQQDGHGVAIWNDSQYANIEMEIKDILRSLGKTGKDWDLSNIVGDAHGKVSSFDSIAFVSRDMLRYAHAMIGNNPNSKNAIKPVISSGGRSGRLLMGKTLFVHSESLDTFFETNKGVDILLSSSGAKMFNEGRITKDGLDDSVINQPFSRLNTTRKIGNQKIRKIPLDALGLKPESDKNSKSAIESQGDYNYMTNTELNKVFNDLFKDPSTIGLESMKSIMEDPIRVRDFILRAFGEDGMGIDAQTGGGKHLSSLAYYSSLTRDADPMSYSDTVVKNKLYNVFINSILNGRRSEIEVDEGAVTRYGGQSYLIQVPDAQYRLKPTVVNSENKMMMRGEMMINHHERNSSVSDIVKSGRDMIFVDGEKTIDPKEFFGSYKERGKEKFFWDDMISEGLTLETLYDIIESGKTATVKPYSQDLQIGMLVNRKPRTRPNDMMILGLKGFLPESYGRSALVNSLDVVNIFEGDYDADKVDYFYGHKKSMFEHAERTSTFFVQGVDPTQFKVPSKFKWSNDAESIVNDIKGMSSNAVLSKKAIGVVQNIPRKLQYLQNLSTSAAEGDPILKRFKDEGREDSPNVLMYTPNPEGGQYRIVIDFDNLDSFSRGALETQYMIDLSGGANAELMGNIRDWSDRYLFPRADESITANEIKKMGIGFVQSNLRNNNNSKRIKIFRKFDDEGREIEFLTDLEKDMIKTMMNEYGKLLNISGTDTFANGGEKRSVTYDDVYSASDRFFLFNKDLSNSLYYRLRRRKDSTGNPYYKDGQFKSMFQPKGKQYTDPKGQEKTAFAPSRDMFEGAGLGIKQNSSMIFNGERGSVLERTLRPMWGADVFENSNQKKFMDNSKITTIMNGEMDSWYQQLVTGSIDEHSVTVDRMQSSIVGAIKDYNSAAYYISKLKGQIIRTQKNYNIPYKARVSIVNKLNKTIKSVSDKVRELAPDKFWETQKSKDLTKFTFTPVVGADIKDAVVQFNTIDNLSKFYNGIGSDGRKHIQAIKDIRKLFYSNYSNLKDVMAHGDKTILNKQSMDFLRDMPDLTTFRDIETQMLKEGWNKYGGIPFILEFMKSPRNDFNIGIHNGKLIPMPYGKTGRYRRGLQFLTEMANETVYDDGRIQMTDFDSGLPSQARQALRILQITEANHRRFIENKFDMRNISDENYTVDIGDGLRFSLENIRIPSFGRRLEKVVDDFQSIKWTRNSSRSGAAFNPINDSYLRFYSDLMEVAGKKEEFSKYLDIMNGLKSDMISNRVIDPIRYLSDKAKIEKDLKHMVTDVITSGVLETGDKMLVSRIKNNPIYILNGGGAADGYWSGRSLEPNVNYSIKKLREAVRVHNDLNNAERVFEFKTERNRSAVDEFIKRCS